MSDFPTAGVKLVAEGAPEFFGQLDQGNQALAQFGQGASSAGDHLSGFGSIAKAAGTALLDFGVQALQNGIRELQQFGQESIQAAMKFDNTMKSIVALTSTGADEIGRLHDQVLALSGQVGIGPQELADGLYFVASSGFAGADAMEVLTASAKAAAAGLGETKTIADLTTSVLNAYGLGADKATWATDILVQAVKEGKAEPQEFAGALGAVLPIAAAAGVSFEEVAASIASMTRIGLNANESVTALRGLIGGLEKPSVGAAKALKSIGLSADDVRASLKDKGLLATLEDLMHRTDGNVAVLGKIIPNIRALTGALATAGSQADSYKASLTAMQTASGSTERAFRVMSQSAEFQQKAFTAAFDALKVEVGEKLLPLLGQAAGVGASLATALMGKVGPALDTIESVVSSIVAAVRAGFIPALAGATAAVIAYAVANSATLLPALAEAVGTIIANTTAWIANAVAVAAAAAPYVLIAAAIGGVVWAWTDFQQKNADATTQLLESRKWWNKATDAIDNYAHAVGSAKEALTPYAATISAIREQIHGEIESLAKRKEAGLISEEQERAEMAAINQHKIALEQATTAYNQQEQALLKTAAASMTGTAQMQQLMTGEAGVAEQTRLTDEELKKLGKQIEKTFQEGGQAVDSYVNTAVSFMAKWSQSADEHTAKILELTKQREEAKTANAREQAQARIDAENKSFAQSQANAAAAYAKEEAAHRAHLGQMLEDYTLEQVKLGNITGETADKILAQIERQFGQTQDISGRTFLAMTQDIDNAGKNGGSALDQLGEHLGNTADDAVATKQKMDELAKQYTIEILDNFDPTKSSLEDLRKQLEDIPRRIDIEIHQKTYKEDNETGKVTGGGVSGTRASGGPVAFGQPYLVGERGPEVFVPQQAGAILPADLTRALLSGRANESLLRYAMPGTVSPPGVQSLARGGDTIAVDQSRHISMPVYTNMTTSAITQAFAISQAML